MTKLIFFGHDAYDPAVKRRITAFGEAGADVLAFTMRRGAAFATPWRNVDLGETKDAAFKQRILALVKGAWAMRKHRAALRGADAIYARNLDMLALAHWARWISGARANVVYECLDVHRFMTRGDALGAVMRGAERALLRASSLLVVSSPAFVREYFEPRHGRMKARIVENRLPPGYEYGPRPAPAPRTGKLRIGWFGVLRCKRSLALLLALADALPEQVEIVIHGAPSRPDLPDFEERISGRANVTFGGRYKWPDDLARIYADVDVVWAGDFHDPGANSAWLLPNRVYEGGYYGAPPIAPAASETGRWIAAHDFGFTLAEPLEETLPAFVASLTRDAVRAAQARQLAAPVGVFVQPETEMRELLAELVDAPVVADERTLEPSPLRGA